MTTDILKSFVVIFRTNLFFKEQKEYSHLVFVLVLIVFLALGAWTWVPAQQVSPPVLQLLVFDSIRVA